MASRHIEALKVGGGYGSTGVTISDAGVIDADGAITSADGLTVGADSKSGTRIAVNGADASNRGLRFQTAGVTRWELLNDTGNDFRLARSNSSGVFQGNPIVVDDATGGVTLSSTLSCGTITAVGSQAQSAPTGVATTNIASISSTSLNYSRYGSQVFFSFRLVCTATAAASTSTQANIPIPIASNFASTSQAAGSATLLGFNNPVSVFADTTNDNLLVQWLSPTTSQVTIFGSGSYLIV